MLNEAECFPGNSPLQVSNKTPLSSLLFRSGKGGLTSLRTYCWVFNSPTRTGLDSFHTLRGIESCAEGDFVLSCRNI